ncbi:MAG: CRP/FNR family cyclic AMP-dependent transcriptional regulator [Paraglaciecola sp.]|jgi:CRP/FNR family cyclic AMP-dependent transcriptional regulator
MDFNKVKPILLKSSWFSSLPDDVVNQLVSLSKPKKLTPGQLLHLKNDPADGLYCVISGRIRVSNYTLEGKELILTWLQPGSWFGEISLFDGLPRSHDAYAEEASELLKIPSRAFALLLAQQPNLYPHFMRLLCQRIRATFSLIDETGSLSLKGQLCKRLLLLADGLEHQAPKTEDLGLSISQESLALLLHTSRQTINKLLQELQQQKLLTVHYGRISLLDKSKLEALSQI